MRNPSVQYSSFAKSCPTLCDPMDCSMPSFPEHHQLLELAQLMSIHMYHVHWYCVPIPGTLQYLGDPLFNSLAKNLSLYLLLSAVHFLQLYPSSRRAKRENIYKFGVGPTVLGPQILQSERKDSPFPHHFRHLTVLLLPLSWLIQLLKGDCLLARV